MQSNKQPAPTLAHKGYPLLQILLISVVLVLWFAPNQGETKPAYESWSVYKAALAGKLPHKSNECESSGDVQTLCQRCAKVTQSNLVYPMCCEDQEEARAWCVSYVTYGS